MKSQRNPEIFLAFAQVLRSFCFVFLAFAQVSQLLLRFSKFFFYFQFEGLGFCKLPLVRLGIHQFASLQMSMEKYCRNVNLLGVVFFKLCGLCWRPRTKKTSQNHCVQKHFGAQATFPKPVTECKLCAKPCVHEPQPHFRNTK